MEEGSGSDKWVEIDRLLDEHSVSRARMHRRTGARPGSTN